MARRRDDDEDEDRDDEDRPRKRRRDREDDYDDEDDDDRPRRKRRRDEDFDDDDYDDEPDQPRRKGDRLDRGTLRSIALFQKGILVCILVYFAVFVAQFFIPIDLRWLLGLGLALPTVLAAVVFVFLLATKVYSPGVGVLLGFLTLFPCIGLIVLLVINSKATTVLKRHGISVGLLGASLSDID